jgi:glycosyltransferase involved in cell wall biosynthesis
MKILWLSNSVLSEHDCAGTGTWLGAMAQRLIGSGEVALANITIGGDSVVTRQDCGVISQWLVPHSNDIKSDGLPSEKRLADLAAIVDEFAPDLIHIWGTEGYWGLLTARKLREKVALLEMQGVKGRIADVFHGGLSFREQLSCVGVKELIRKSTIWQQRNKFRDWGRYENEIISGHRYIGTQTRWVESQVKAINSDCITFHNDLILREPFYSAKSWDRPESHQIFCLAAYPMPFKGLHTAVRAFAIIRQRFSSARLNIAGGFSTSGLRRDGYIAWVVTEIRRLGLKAHVNWLGPLDAQQIVEQMQNSSAMVIPSFIENCSTSMQEAMLIGVPLAVSYAGGLPSLAKDEEAAVFYPMGDDAACAMQLERLFDDKELAMRLSRQARQVAEYRNDPRRIIARQLEIYRQIISDAQREKQ